jgi:hypothetical protein
MPRGHILYIGRNYFYTLMRNKRDLQSLDATVIMGYD